MQFRSRLAATLIACASALLATFSSPRVTAAAAAAAAAGDRPNIIVILVDDMGFSDIGCYGSEIPTPNLDGLAANGVRFTQFYNTGRCCPTRATLLTGLYAHQTGVGHMTDDNNLPGYRGRLNDQCVTMGEVMKGAGYFTAMTGKWHVGQAFGVTPSSRGFDRSLNAAAGGFYFPNDPRTELFYNGHKTTKDDPIPADWYSTDLWTSSGLKFVDEALAAKKPFFWYLAHNAPHFPLEAPAEDIAKFRGKYKAGWDKLREERHARQLKLGIVDESWGVSPRPEAISAWDSLSDADKDRMDHIMAIYAACVYHMDKSIGDLVAGLKQRGVFDNTLILFMSDNGGNAESGPKGRLEGKGKPGGSGSLVYCGESWAFLENTPLRRYKHFNHEGGISTPLIAHWPAQISAHGELRTQPAHLIDIMATCVDVGGAAYPKEFHGKPILPMEGTSLRPAFANQPLQRDAIYWEHEGNAAIREGDWKLVRMGMTGPWELYDLKKDRTEQHDLTKQDPTRAKAMQAKWEAWAKRANVLPSPKEGKAAKPGKEKDKGKAKKKGGAPADE